MKTVRLLGIGWWLQLKMRSRSAFDGALAIAWPIFFSTSIFLIYRQQTDTTSLLAASIGASVMGIWTAATTTAASSLQNERRQGTLELLVLAPRPLALTVVPIILSMATIGIYSLVATLLWGKFVLGIALVISNVPMFILGCVVIAVTVAAMGFILALGSVRYRTSWALGAVVELPVWLICGFVVPLSILPAWVAPISWAIPITWAVDAVKAAAVGSVQWGDVLLAIGISVVYFAVGAYLSRVLVNSARRNASLTLI
jgi:ABC-2 type transport system permease protein